MHSLPQRSSINGKTLRYFPRYVRVEREMGHVYGSPDTLSLHPTRACMQRCLVFPDTPALDDVLCGALAWRSAWGCLGSCLGLAVSNKGTRRGRELTFCPVALRGSSWPTSVVVCARISPYESFETPNIFRCCHVSAGPFSLQGKTG